MLRLVLEMHPRIDSELFHGYSYGIAVCWTSIDEPSAARIDAEQRMTLERWVVDRVQEVESVECPRDGEDDHVQGMFRVASLEGFAARIDCGRRIYVDLNREVWKDEDVAIPLQRLFVEFCQRIRAQGKAFALYSDEDEENDDAPRTEWVADLESEGRRRRVDAGLGSVLPQRGGRAVG